MQRIVIIGASSGIAEHCARLWVRDASLVLVGRDALRLEPIAADLRVRNPDAAVQVVSMEGISTAAIERVVNRIAAGGAIDMALIAQGMLPDQQATEQDLALMETALTVTGTVPVLYAQMLASIMERQGYGTLGIIGSVAGDLPRRSNYSYGAAKAMLAFYTQGLQQRFAGTNVKIVLIKPGPVDTKMTMHLSLHKISAGVAAATIVAGMRDAVRVIYVPGYWRWIMAILAHAPETVRRRV